MYQAVIQKIPAGPQCRVGSFGRFQAGGAAAYLDKGTNNIAAPQQTMIDPWAAGGFVGGGVGVYITNAQSPNQLQGPFAQWNADIGGGNGASVSVSHVWTRLRRRWDRANNDDGHSDLGRYELRAEWRG